MEKTKRLPFIVMALGLLLSIVLSLHAGVLRRQRRTGNVPPENIYGCIECHPSTLSCHIDWQRSELEKIRELWNLSFHVKLQKDDFEPFSICYAFFLKGDCFFCHPYILTPNATVRRPQFRPL